MAVFSLKFLSWREMRNQDRRQIILSVIWKQQKSDDLKKGTLKRKQLEKINLIYSGEPVWIQISYVLP